MCRTPAGLPLQLRPASLSTREIRDKGAAGCALRRRRLRRSSLRVRRLQCVVKPATRTARPAQSSLSPTIRLTAGWDDNVFRVNKADNPIGDFMTTISPDVQASLRMSRLRVSGRSRGGLHPLQESQSDQLHRHSRARACRTTARATDAIFRRRLDEHASPTEFRNRPSRQASGFVVERGRRRATLRKDIYWRDEATVACGLQGRHELPRHRSRAISRCDGGDHWRGVSVFLDALHYHRSRRRAGPN